MLCAITFDICMLQRHDIYYVVRKMCMNAMWSWPGGSMLLLAWKRLCKGNEMSIRMHLHPWACHWTFRARGLRSDPLWRGTGAPGSRSNHRWTCRRVSWRPTKSAMVQGWVPGYRLQHMSGNEHWYCMIQHVWFHSFDSEAHLFAGWWFGTFWFSHIYIYW